MYFHLMCIQPKEHRTLSFVQQQFLNLQLVKSQFSTSNDENRRRNDASDLKEHPNHGGKNSENRKRFNNSKIDDDSSSSKCFIESNKSSSSSSSSKSPASKDRKSGGIRIINGIKVHPGKKPSYTPEQSEKLKNLDPKERRKYQCDHCGQYFHSADRCKNPRKQCYRCWNFCHEGKVG